MLYSTTGLTLVGSIAIAMAAGVWIALLHTARRRRRTAGTSALPDPEHIPQSTRDKQDDEIKILLNLIDGKGEMDLRIIFDYPNMLARNIELLRIRNSFFRKSPGKVFNYEEYAEGDGGTIEAARIGRLAHGPSGSHFDAGPNEVLVLVLTEKYQRYRNVLVSLGSSEALPRQIKDAIGKFGATISDNARAMISTLNEKINEGPIYINQSDKFEKEFYVLVNDLYVAKFTPLKPAAEELLSVVDAWRRAR